MFVGGPSCGARQSGAGQRRAPNTQMMVSLIPVSCVRRQSTIYDRKPASPRHPPCLVASEEKNVLLVVPSPGTRAFAGAFNSTITKAALLFIGEQQDPKGR